jgi:predicted Zn-dependent protease
MGQIVLRLFSTSVPHDPRLSHCRSWLSAFIAALAVLICIAGCSRPFEGEGPGHREQALALHPTQELAIGREAFAELLSDAQVMESGADVDRVERVSRQIARTIEIEPLQREINLHVAEYPFEWEYRVIVSRQINAFCLPGGKIGVYTGLLRLVRNDDQLAAVIAHEVAHAVAHHASERIARAQSMGRGFPELSFDREQESEADHIGVGSFRFPKSSRTIPAIGGGSISCKAGCRWPRLRRRLMSKVGLYRPTDSLPVMGVTEFTIL